MQVISLIPSHFDTLILFLPPLSFPPPSLPHLTPSSLFSQLCGAEKPYLSPEKLEKKHKTIMQACVTQFQSTRKMGGESFSRVFEERLTKEILEMFESFMKRNESKHILNAYRTPAVLITIMALSYFVSSVLDMLGIESLSQTAIFGLYIPLLCVCVWAYVRFSGNFREAGQAIDNVTDVMWENVSRGGGRPLWIMLA